jgi:hypothetical protein
MMDPFQRNQVMKEVEREIALLLQLRGCENCCQWESDIAVRVAHGRETEIRLYMKFYNGKNLADIMRGEIDDGYVLFDIITRCNGIEHFCHVLWIQIRLIRVLCDIGDVAQVKKTCFHCLKT